MAKAKIKYPTCLGAEGKKEYKRIMELLLEEKVDFREKDLKLLEMYAKNYETWIRAEKFLDENGNSYVCKSGYPAQYPEVNIGNTAQKNMLSIMKELGLTPAARSRMGNNQSSPTDSYSSEDAEMEAMFENE